MQLQPLQPTQPAPALARGNLARLHEPRLAGGSRLRSAATATRSLVIVVAARPFTRVARRARGAFKDAPGASGKVEVSIAAPAEAAAPEKEAEVGAELAAAAIQEAQAPRQVEVVQKAKAERLPRITQKVKKAYVRWAEDGRRVYVNSEGRQVSPWKGYSSESSAQMNGQPKEQPRDQVEVSEDVDPEQMIFGQQRQPFPKILQPELLEALDSLGFRHATRIQATSIDSILSDDRRAVILSSETGSGKTLAYLVPAFELILRRPPRQTGASNPEVLIMVPSLELAVQVSLVAQQLAQAIQTSRTITVRHARRNWPEKAPDILVCTPRAGAQGLAPAQSADEMTRKQALKRIQGTELMVLDEADLLLDHGSQSTDVQTVLTALAASFPAKPRLVQSEAQVYRPDGIPVEFLDRRLEWTPGLAWHNADGTFKVKLENGHVLERIRRRSLKGPGLGLLVENGPRFVAACATLPSYASGRCISEQRQQMQDNSFFNSGIGSVDWVLKRWYPNALRIRSPWLHKRHPGIQREAWLYIPGEDRKNGQKAGTGKLNLPLRIQKTIELLQKQDADLQTIIFANTPEACLAFERAAKEADIQVANVHAGVSFSERIEGLKKFGLGEVPAMICTDLGARGLDLPICHHVIQLEFAGNTISYLHRVGRATRAANKSQVTNFWGAPDIPVKDLIMKAPDMGSAGTWSAAGAIDVVLVESARGNAGTSSSSSAPVRLHERQEDAHRTSRVTGLQAKTSCAALGAE